MEVILEALRSYFRGIIKKVEVKLEAYLFHMEVILELYKFFIWK